MINRILAVGILVLLGACTSVPQPAQNAQCDFGVVKVSAKFEGARLSGCAQTPDGTIDLTIAPENTPINNSAWYGFDLSGEQGATINLALIYENGKHRYSPKVQTLEGWERLNTQISLSDEKKRAAFSVTLRDTPLRIAAQPVLDLAIHKAWIDKAEALDFVSLSEIGQSTEKRPIYKLEETDAPDIKKPYVVIVGRQHPPETTGALALMPFVDTIWGDSALANQFRSEFNLIVLPVLNPDGVVHGYWRHNVNGIDLNRDWGPFSQTETQAVQREFERFESGEDRIVLFLDFHSTWRNLIYTQTDAEPSTPKFFTRDWIANVDANLPEAVYSYTREANETTDRPVSKNYMYSTYKIPAMTFEVGDETLPENIEAAAPIFAQEMMRLLLEELSDYSAKAQFSPKGRAYP